MIDRPNLIRVVVAATGLQFCVSAGYLLAGLPACDGTLPGRSKNCVPALNECSGQNQANCASGILNSPGKGVFQCVNVGQECFSCGTNVSAGEVVCFRQYECIWKAAVGVCLMDPTSVQVFKQFTMTLIDCECPG